MKPALDCAGPGGLGCPCASCDRVRLAARTRCGGAVVLKCDSRFCVPCASSSAAARSRRITERLDDLDEDAEYLASLDDEERIDITDEGRAALAAVEPELGEGEEWRFPKKWPGVPAARAAAPPGELLRTTCAACGWHYTGDGPCPVCPSPRAA